MIPVTFPSPTSNTQRLFFALWPELEIATRLHDLAGKPMHGAGRRVPPENIHLTLAFLGAVPASFRQCAERVATAIHGEPFTLVLEQLGCWSKSGIL